MITERPYRYNYSKNDIRYIFTLVNPARVGLRLQVKLQYAEIGSIIFTTLYQFELKPDATGTVYFYLQDYLNSLLEYVVPDANLTLTNADKQARQFYIEFREVDADNPNPDWDTSEADNIAYVIKGGIERQRASRNNIFINYLELNKPFLTWWQTGRFIMLNEQGYLTFFNPGIDTAGHRIEINGFNSDGTGSQTMIPFNGNGFLFHLLIGPGNINLANLVSGQPYYYEISVIDAANNLLAGPYRFYIEHRPIYNYYDLMFFNSLGGIDFIRVKGDLEQGIDRDYTESEGGFNLSDWNSPVKIHQAAQTGINKREHWTGDAGWQKRKEDQLSLTEILVSEKIYYYLDGRWVPVLLVQKNQSLGLTSAKLYSFPLEWTSSYAEQVYTPKSVNLGFGFVCVIGGFAGSPDLPDATSGTLYNYSFELTGSSPFTLTNKVMPAWMDISVSGTTVTFTGVPTDDDIANDITVSFTINNCSGNPLNFADTFNVEAAMPGCIPAAFTGTPVMPDATQYFGYYYSIDLTGTAPFTLTEIVKPGWMIITLTGSTIEFTGTPGTDDVATDLEVSFVVNNCAGDTLPFNDAIDVAENNLIFWRASVPLSDDGVNLYDQMNIQGVPGSTLTFKVSSFTNLVSGTLYVDGVAKVLNDTFTIVLDGAGAGSFVAHLQNMDGDHGPMVVQFIVIAATAGDFSSTGLKQTSKIY